MQWKNQIFVRIFFSENCALETSIESLERGKSSQPLAIDCMIDVFTGCVADNTLWIEYCECNDFRKQK